LIAFAFSKMLLHNLRAFLYPSNAKLPKACNINATQKYMGRNQPEKFPGIVAGVGWNYEFL
jgi:hypothetical protein